GIAAHRHQRAVGHAQLGKRADCGDDGFAFVELGRALRHALWRAFATDAHVADDGEESTRFCALRADRACGCGQRREEHQGPARFNKHLHVSSLEVQAQTLVPALYPAKEKCPTLSLSAVWAVRRAPRNGLSPSARPFIAFSRPARTVRPNAPRPSAAPRNHPTAIWYRSKLLTLNDSGMNRKRVAPAFTLSWSCLV